MTVSWTPHRFTGGILALDTANTVVLRNDPEKTFDRFADLDAAAGEAVGAGGQEIRQMAGGDR
ncbi:MAG: hypothetical protein E5W99_14370, partial [Mesorhizobium sp.]